MKNNKMWIWQHDSYPDFTYDKNELKPLIDQTIKDQGILEGAFKYISSQDCQDVKLETSVNEIMITSKLEGEILKRSSVRESLRRLSQSQDAIKKSEHTDNLAQIQKDANDYSEPITIERLTKWHEMLFTEGEYDLDQVKPGEIRDYDEMYISSGEGIRERIHYLALPARKIGDELSKLIDYCNNSYTDAIIKSAIVHIWFEQIHPFGDGNGRIGRNLTNHILSKEMGLDTNYFSLSSAIVRNGSKYYDTLESTNRLTLNPTLDLTEWIKIHTAFISDALNTTIKQIDSIVEKTNLYDKLKNYKVKDSQSEVIGWLLNNRNSVITNAVYRAITGTNSVTASRHLSDLVKKQILVKNKEGEGRSTSYKLNIKFLFDRESLQSKMEKFRSR